MRSLLALLLLGWGTLVAAELSWPLLPEGVAQISQELGYRLDSGRLEGEVLLQRARVTSFYEVRQRQPAWLAADGVVPGAGELLGILDEVSEEGLPAGGYHREAIRQLLKAPLNSEGALARLDILLTDAFLAYSLDVRRGRFDPRSVDDDWFILPDDDDMGRVLQYSLETRTIRAMLHSMPPYQQGYRRLRRTLRDYRAIAAQGGWPPLAAGEVLRPGGSDGRVATLRRRLLVSGDLPAVVVEDDQVFDADLEEAVRRFQYRHGLPEDGAVGEATRRALNVPVEQRIAQLQANMERWRWLPRQLEPHYLMVNMTGFQLDVMKEDRSVMRMRVIIGSDYRQTPVFASHLAEIIFNPSWYVPSTIFKNDLLPEVKQDASYLGRRGIRVLADMASGGREVDPQTIDWNLYDTERFPYALHQPPGVGNPLGQVKFVIPNRYGIYLHDTPNRTLFSRRERTFSSGCIRLEKPLALATYLLQHEPGMAEVDIASYLARKGTVGVKLSQSWPVYLLYWTAWVDEDGVVQFRDDVYNRDSRLIAAQAPPAPAVVGKESATARPALGAPPAL